MNSFFLRMSPQRTLPLTFQCADKLISAPIFSHPLFPELSRHEPSLLESLAVSFKMLLKLIGRGWVEGTRCKNHTCP